MFLEPSNRLPEDHAAIVVPKKYLELAVASIQDRAGKTEDYLDATSLLNVYGGEKYSLEPEPTSFLEQTAELAGQMAQIWADAEDALQRALTETRTAVAKLSQGRAALQKADPVTREQLAEEVLLQGHAKDMQAMIQQVGHQAKKAGIQRRSYEGRKDALEKGVTP
jgi:dGTP triphosphohydrolase